MKKIGALTDSADRLISELFDGLSVPKDPEFIEYYQWPVRVKRTGGSVYKPEYEELQEGDKPWVVGHHYPNKYLNETHPHGHNGMDLNAPEGTPVYPIAPGVVGTINRGKDKGGNVVYVSHENGSIVSRYAHLKDINVSTGDEVDFNTQIGTVGKSGNATSYHLHFEVRKDRVNQINPSSVIGREVGSLSAVGEDKLFALRKMAGKYKL